MKKFAGILILLIAVIGVLVWQFLDQGGGAESSQDDARGAHPPRGGALVVGKAGSEKMPFLHDPAIVKILRDDYGITLDVKKAGSVEMVNEPPVDQDFLWPASQVNLEMFTANGYPYKKYENMFNSPIVFYSWAQVTDALAATGVVQVVDGTRYVVKLPALVEFVERETSWKDIGLGDLYGKVAVISTDPTRSNSGNMFAALLANMLNNESVVTDETVEDVIRKVTPFFKKLGHMEHSSGVLFEKYLSQGIGAYPIIVGYENQIIEFLLEHPQQVATLVKPLRILYPKPTVWASHPFIALTDPGVRLMEALQDEKIQALAWKHHGFRSNRPTAVGTLAVAADLSLPETITAVMPTPSAGVMSRITEALRF